MMRRWSVRNASRPLKGPGRSSGAKLAPLSWRSAQAGLVARDHQPLDFRGALVDLGDLAEVWIHAHALWIMRNGILFLFMSVFAVVWFIPLFFFAWNSNLWVTASTVAGVVFSAIAWLFLLNAWLKGLSKYLKNKAVF